MKKGCLLILGYVLLLGTAGWALEITSVAPQRATPETAVTVSGGPFSAQSKVVLGEQPVRVSRALPQQLEFIVPELPPGNYTLTIDEPDETVMAHFIFEVLPRRPEISGISPDNLDVCADAAERTVQISGRNFLPDTLLLLDGKVVAGRFIDAGGMEIRVPDLPAGVYGVEARQTNGASSLPHSLWINSVPEIISVERGEDLVNNYDMIIRGKNFFYNSILLVKEPENPASGRDYRILALQAGIGSQAQKSNMAMRGEGLYYENCETLVYRRYPMDMQDKDLQLEVINPDGKKTGFYAVTMP